MTKDRPPTYTPAPEPPTDPELRKRYDEILAVISQQHTVSEAARNLAMSRNHFQTILHRAIQAVIEAITPKPAGRPAKPEREAMLEAENQKLRAELSALEDRAAMLDRLMTVMGGISSGRMPLPRSRKSSKKKSEDPEPAPSEMVIAMREADIPIEVCAGLLRVSTSTIQRRTRGCRRTPQLVRRREVDPVIAQRVRALVNESHGLIGAASLGKRFELPRRTCAEIKKRELREMELMRKAACLSVIVASPGVVRGFDAMHVQCTDAKAMLLVAGDAAIPYRTSIACVASYDSASVCTALRRDFETHGAPLVLRLDRIACQRTPEVEAVLADFGVLALYGPPRHPGYYGQLERQNREHRQWLDATRTLTTCELETACRSMRSVLNAEWARPTLNWCTAESVWNQRPAIGLDRRELRARVDEQTAHLTESGVEFLRARRQAIEAALTTYQLLTIKSGGWC